MATEATQRLMDDLLRLFTTKYEDAYMIQDFYHGVAVTAALLRETELVKERLRVDPYDLFAKDDYGELLGEGSILRRTLSVVAFNKAETTDAFDVSATVQWDFRSGRNEQIQLVTSSKKRKYPDGADGIVQLHYKFDDVTEGGKERGKGVPVLDSPCKVVSLQIFASRGRLGSERTQLVDFQLFTAGWTSAEVKCRIPLSHNGGGGINQNQSTECSDGGGGDKGEDNNDDEGGPQRACDDDDVPDGDDDNDDDDGDEDDQFDTADYYKLDVDIDALSSLASWIQDETGCAHSALAPVPVHTRTPKKPMRGSADLDEKKQNMLMLILSLPYVDEAWGLHDLILDSICPDCDDDNGDDGGDVDDDDDDDDDDNEDESVE